MAMTSKSVKSPRVVNIEDLRDLARRRLPKMVFDYLEAAEGEIERARAAGYSALVVTVDTAVAGMRERDFRNGVTELLGDRLFAKIPFLAQILGRPGWLMDFLLDGGLPQLPNVVIPGQGVMPLQDVSTSLARGAITWEDLKWIQNCWPGPIVIKGVLTGDDARRALDEGAVAVVVSNHGGGQLYGVPATLPLLPEIVSAVNGRAEVLMDGGIRCGSDIVKANCLGSRALLIRRAYAYGLAAAGEAGGARPRELLGAGVERTLVLLGGPCVPALNSSFISPDRAP